MTAPLPIMSNDALPGHGRPPHADGQAMKQDGQDVSVIVVGEQLFDVGALAWVGNLPGHPTWVHEEEGQIWQVDAGGALRRVDARSQRVVWSRELSGAARLLAVGHEELLVATMDELWVFDRDEGVGRELTWFEDVEIEHLVHLGSHAVVGLSDSSVRAWNLVTGEESCRISPWATDGTVSVPPHFRPIPEGPVRREDTLLLPTRRVSFCVLTELDRTFDLRTFEPHGNLLWQKEIEHTGIVWLDGVARVLDKRIELRAMGRRWLLFGPCGPGTTSVVLRLAAGETTEVEADVSAVVEDVEGWVRGLLVVEPEAEVLRMLEPDGVRERWRQSFDFAPCNAATVLTLEEGVVVALHHPFQREVIVSLVEPTTGEVRWRTRLAFPYASWRLRHQFNGVELVAVRDRLVVRLSQSPQVYIRVLDRLSGQCIFPLWDTLADRLE